VKHTTRWSRAILDGIESKLDVESLAQVPTDRIELNDIATVRLRLASPLMLDSYEENRFTGAFILTDEATNDTVAACMVVSAEP
jgi:sulfate adenylyltransferase subunit 1